MLSSEESLYLAARAEELGLNPLETDEELWGAYLFHSGDIQGTLFSETVNEAMMLTGALPAPLPSPPPPPPPGLPPNVTPGPWAPRSLPDPPPKPKLPKPGTRVHPIGLILEELAKRVAKRMSCRLAGRMIYQAGEKKRPSGKPNPSKRRRRPCRGGATPNVSYRRRRRLIGWISFDMHHGNQAARPITDPKDRFTRPLLEARIAKELGKGTRRKTIEVEGPFDWTTANDEADRQKDPTNRPKGIPIAAPKGKPCWYRIWQVGKRRICTCPDGTKCRSTSY